MTNNASVPEAKPSRAIELASELSVTEQNQHLPRIVAAVSTRDYASSARGQEISQMQSHRFVFVALDGMRYEMLDFNQLSERCGQYVYEYYHPTFFRLKPKVKRKNITKFESKLISHATV
jgi:hypothetical protein